MVEAGAFDTVREDRLRYEGWPVVGACGVGALFATVPLTTFGVFLQPLCDHFSWSRESASSAFGTLTLVAAASAPWLGGVLGRIGVRRVIVSCLALSGSLVASLSLLTPSLWHLRIIFGVLGLVMMGASPIAYSRSRAFWTLVVVVFGGTIATNGALVHLVALLADRGVPAGQAALSASAMAGASLVGRILTGWLLDRFEAARVSAVLLLIAAAGTFALATAQSFGMGVLAAICLGFGAGGETDVTPYLLARHFGLRSLSTLYGFNWTAWGVAGVAGPILLGRAFDVTGSYTAAMIELGVVTLVAAGLMLTFPAASPNVTRSRL